MVTVIVYSLHLSVLSPGKMQTSRKHILLYVNGVYICWIYLKVFQVFIIPSTWDFTVLPVSSASVFFLTVTRNNIFVVFQAFLNHHGVSLIHGSLLTPWCFLNRFSNQHNAINSWLCASLMSNFIYQFKMPWPTQKNTHRQV